MREWVIGLLVALFAECTSSSSSTPPGSDTSTPSPADPDTGREVGALDTGSPPTTNTTCHADSGMLADSGFAPEPPVSALEINSITVYQHIAILDCHDEYCVDSWVVNEWGLARYHNDSPEDCPDCDISTTMRVWRKWFSCGLIDAMGREDDILAVGLSSTTQDVYINVPTGWIPLDQFTGSTFSDRTPGIHEWRDYTTGTPRYSAEYWGSSPCADVGSSPGYFTYNIQWY
ncbi:MAG: hypothetical protein ACPGTU_02710 [Myxococcota bacterium]